VRNDKDLAQDNPILIHDEAGLVVGHIGGRGPIFKGLEARAADAYPEGTRLRDAIERIRQKSALESAERLVGVD
jgi:hypothetical protein